MACAARRWRAMMGAAGKSGCCLAMFALRALCTASAAGASSRAGVSLLAELAAATTGTLGINTDTDPIEERPEGWVVAAEPQRSDAVRGGYEDVWRGLGV